ncbi:MAG: cytochrome P450 [Pseudomonadota bacterium]
MSNAPVYHIDPARFWADPYPDLQNMRLHAPIAYVPELDATLLTRHADIATCEKNTAVFSSWQPDGLMTRLMGENLMRRDGQAHMRERKAIYPAMSPQTVKQVWQARFAAHTKAILNALAEANSGDLFWLYAMPVSAKALCSMTGLTRMSAEEMNAVSQGMIDGCANYAGDPDVTAHCHACTAKIDQAIDAHWPSSIGEETDLADTEPSLLTTQIRAGLSETRIRANIKLAISGGQNEPRDAIAGAIWALLTHPEQLALLHEGKVSWLAAFEEYARWISPIGMSPRRIAQAYSYAGVEFAPEDRVFLMFSSGNRDSEVFPNPDKFDITRSTKGSLSFGAGPHYCAGAWASRSLIADVALPSFFECIRRPRITGQVPFGGWAFRGPLALPCQWDH